ncbi:MAG: hypothetical protein SVR94_18245 [Pseudomonadota bacterium]|nr:hypothetical protein [Pseudomonadota bacterium]
MQNIKHTQTIHAQEPALDTQSEQPAYMPPKITVYKEEELLKTVTVLGCSPQAI